MNFELTKEQIEYRNEVELFARKNLNGKEEMHYFSRELWDKISELGILGITVSEEYGGMNEDYQTAAILMEALGYACVNNGFVFVVNNHIWVAQNLIYLYGTEYLKKKYLDEMVKGRKIGAFALTECDSGSDACHMR